MERIGRAVFAMLLIACGGFAQQNEPPVTLSPTAYKTVLRFIDPGNYGYQNATEYDIGWRWSSGEQDYWRSLYKFDLSGLPSNAVIVSASLSSSITNAHGNGPAITKLLAASVDPTGCSTQACFEQRYNWAVSGSSVVSQLYSETKNTPITASDIQTRLSSGRIVFGGSGPEAGNDSYATLNLQLTITYYRGATQVTVFQKLSTQAPTSQGLGHWEGGPDFVSYPTGYNIPITVPSTQAFRGGQDVESGEKYSKWIKGSTDEPTVLNHHVFSVQQGFPSTLTSQFKTTTQGSTIRVDLLEQPGNYDWAIQFKDPWLIDYPDPNYNNKLRNQGISAPPKSRSTPFHPDLETSYGGDVYKGVFLNQRPEDGPYYSVGGPSGQPYGGFTWNFGKWLSNPNVNGQPKAEFQDASSQNTGLVFKEADAIVTAQMKAHLGSNAAQALGSNQQRKLSRWKDGVIYQWNGYKLVYESGGQIWSLFSTNMGGTWWPEQLVSTNPGVHRSPSLGTGTLDNGVPINNDIVWHTNLGGVDQIWWQRLSTTPVLVGNFAAHASIPAAPVVAFRGYSSTHWTSIVACTGANNIEVMKLDGTTNTWNRDTYSDLLVSRYRPSLGYAGIYGGNPVYLTYDDGRRVYWDYFKCYSFYEGCTEAWRRLFEHDGEKVVPGSVSNRSGFRGSAQVVGIPTSNSPKFGVVWQTAESLIATDEPQQEEMDATEDNGGLINIDLMEYSVCFQSYDGFQSPSNQWSTMKKFAGLFYKAPTISHLQNNQMLWTWTDGQSVLSSQSTNDGSTWSAPVTLHEGIDPQVLIGAENQNQVLKYAYRSLSGPIYQVSVPQGVLQEDEPGDETREIAVADTSSDAFVSVEMSPLSIETSQTTSEKIPFAVTEDSAFVPSVDNLEQYLGTTSHAVPQNADKIRLRIHMSSNGASSLAFGDTPLRVKLDYTVNDSTRRVLARWRFRGSHFLNKALRLSARPLRGKSVKFYVSILGLNRVNPDAQVSATSVYRVTGTSAVNKNAAQQGEEIPRIYGLHQNYPNPFNPTTEIRFDLPDAGNVSLVVYDVLGRKVAELANGYREAGYHSTTWNATDQASGVYFARFVATDALGKVRLVKTNKLLLMK